MEADELAQIRDDGALLNALGHNPLVNPASGMGTARDRSVYTQIGTTNLLTRDEVEQAYSGDWLCRRVVDLLAYEATKNPPLFVLGGQEGQLKRAAKMIAAVQQSITALDVMTVLREAAILARLYGGAAIIMGLDDGQEADQPLNAGSLRRVAWLRAVDRHHITPGPSMNPMSPDIYQLNVGSGGASLPGDNTAAGTQYVHPDRVLRIEGEFLPSILRRTNQGWGASVLQRMIGVWKQYRTATAASAAMVDAWDLFFHRITGLSQLIAAGKEDAIRKRLEANTLGRSVWRSMVIDESEEIGWINRSVGGVSDIIDRLRDDLQGATGLDHTILFGQSPSGLGATGRLEERNLAKSVIGYANGHLKAPLHRLTELLLLSREGPTQGRVPDVWDIEFQSPFEVYPEEQAALRASVAQTDALYIGQGVLRPEEVAQARFGGTEWSGETALARDNGAPPQIEAAAQANAIAAIKAVAAGEIPVDAGTQLVMRLLGVSEQEAKTILGSAGEDVPEPQPVPNQLQGQQPDGTNAGPPQPDAQMQTDREDASPLVRTTGKPLTAMELNKLANVTEEDIRVAVEDWNASAPAKLRGLLEAKLEEPGSGQSS